MTLQQGELVKLAGYRGLFIVAHVAGDRVYVYPLGGGIQFPVHVEAVSYAASERPPLLQPAKVWLSGIDGVFNAYLDESDRWNGFCRPYFTREVAEDVVRKLDRHNRYRFTWHNNELYMAGELYAYRQTVETVTGPVEAWPVGAGDLCWCVQSTAPVGLAEAANLIRMLEDAGVANVAEAGLEAGVAEVIAKRDTALKLAEAYKKKLKEIEHEIA